MSVGQKVCDEISVINRHCRSGSWFTEVYAKETNRARDALLNLYQAGNPQAALESLPYRRWQELLKREYEKVK